MTPSAYAQEPTPFRGVVSVTATEELLLVPEQIRLQMLVRAESREGSNALKIMQRHKERVTKDLVALGASESSIVFSKSTLTVGIPGVENPEVAQRWLNQQAAQIAQMRNLNPQFRAPPAASNPEDTIRDLPQIFQAMASLSAEWKLDNGLNEAAVLLMTQLRTAIDEKDFKGKKLKEPLDSDEQQMIQPLLTSGAYSISYQQPEMQLIYVSMLTEAKEADALASAFKKAQSQASILANAAGRKIGNIRTISSNANSLSQNYPSPYVTAASGAAQTSPLKNNREIGAENPNALKTVVAINISFELE